MCFMGSVLISLLTYVVISDRLLHVFGKDSKINQPQKHVIKLSTEGGKDTAKF